MLTAFLSAQIALAGVEDINRHRFFLLDHSEEASTFLFRGNTPTTNSHSAGPVFAYGLLSQYLTDAAAVQNKTLPADFGLLIVNLMNYRDPDEGKNIDAGFAFKKAHPALFIDYINWEMIGTNTPISGSFTPNNNSRDSFFPVNASLLVTASNLSAWDFDSMASHWIDQLHMWVQTPTPSSFATTVILFHCGHGQDRTGAVAGAYNMKWKNQDFDTVWAFNKALGMDVPANVNQMRWYWLWLQSLASSNSTGLTTLNDVTTSLTPPTLSGIYNITVQRSSTSLPYIPPQYNGTYSSNINWVSKGEFIAAGFLTYIFLLFL